MRFDGTLTQWNDDKGFGFVMPAQGGQDVFIHISSFPRHGRRPQLQEPLSFEIELNKEGKKRAVSVRRSEVSYPSSRPSSRPSRQVQPARTARSFFIQAVAVLLLVALGVYGYANYSKRASAYGAADARASSEGSATQTQQPLLTNQRCDGRQHCSQMTSCAEAKFFLKNCPGVQMDGNHDGVPCEQQWCTNPLAP